MFVSKTNVINVYKQDMDNFVILKRICNFYIYLYIFIYIYIYFLHTFVKYLLICEC